MGNWTLDGWLSSLCPKELAMNFKEVLVLAQELDMGVFF